MTHSDPDHDTWLRFISGDSDAFSDLYDQYADVLYAFGMRYSTDRDLVKDCIHDLFIDLHGYRKNLAQEVNVKFYLLKSLRRKLHLAHRKSSMLRFDRWDTEDSLAINAFTFSIEQQLITDDAGVNNNNSKVPARLWDLYHDMQAFQNEAVFFVTRDKDNNWQGDIYPPSWGGSSRQMPVQEQVDEYEYIAESGVVM